MKINSKKETLVESLHSIQAPISSRTTLPILHNFLIETEDDSIKLVRTDLEMAITHYFKAEIENAGNMTVPTKEFSDMLNSLPADSEVKIFADKNNKVHINCGKSKFWVMGTPKDEYPLVPTMDKTEQFKLPTEVLSNLVSKTVFAASTQETRYVLSGVLWVCSKNKLEIVATDGRRLALASYSSPDLQKEFKVIVPIKVLQEANRCISVEKPGKNEDITIGITSNQIGFKIKETTLISRLIEGNFPNYDQVIPSKKEVIFSAEVKDLLAITKRASLCISDKGGAVKYKLKDKTLFVNASSQKMEFEDEIAVDYSGDEFEIAFNPQYIVDVLKNMTTEKVTFGMTTSVNPVLIEPVGQTDCRYVVMPVRI
jgi:DNA polymerase III subunit beta